MKLAAVVVAGVVCAATHAAEPAQRGLTFDERVAAQTAIERVYYSHQVGATRSFDAAVPRPIIEGKVRKALEQSAALSRYWETAITDDSLQREMARIAQGTRMPERLLELYTALGNDPFVVKETLARATLVDRLAHNFYAFDRRLHGKARAQAEALRRQLVSDELSAAAEHPNRTVTQLVLSDDAAPPAPDAEPFLQRLNRDEFNKRRSELPSIAGRPSAIREDSDAFSFSVLLSESPTELRVATYGVSKTPWDTWWSDAHVTLHGEAVTAVASSLVDLPPPNTRGQAATGTCPGDDTWEQWIFRGVPTARRNHSAVWTGSAMIVWGGFGQTNWVNTGSRYDPATDTWLPTSTTGAPAPRQLHRAVWTGASMVVWGGRGVSNAYLGTGGRYDPFSDTWLPISTVSAPTPRVSSTAVWTGSRMVIWGGGNNTSILQSGARYDPVNDTWTPTSTVNAPAARTSHTAVWTGSKMVIWGGSASGVTATGGLYDPVNDVWTPTSASNAPSARAGHAAVWTGSVMVVWGGTTSTEYSDTGGRYDPSTDAWTATSTVGAPSGRSGHQAVWTGSRVIVWGGSFVNSQGMFEYLDAGGRYDPISDTWMSTSSIGAPFGRGNHSLLWTGTAMIVWGGYRFDYIEDVDVFYDTGGRYDPATDSWTPTSLVGTPRARTSHTAIWTGNVMVVWGGTNGNTDFNAGGRYDPVTDFWASTSTVNAPLARYLHSAVWTGDAMLIWGGASQLARPDYAVDTGGTYDPIADSWTPISTIGAPSKRYGAPTVWTGHEMLVWGGAVQSTYPTTGGRYDPSTNTWSAMSMEGAPSGRYYASAIWTGRSMVVWGGNSSASPYPKTGGRYDPSRNAWTPTSLAGAPAGRWVHTTIWTGRAMVVWGGYVSDGAGETQTGGRYDPVLDSWTPTSTVAAPSPRGGLAAVWTGREMVVWSGYGSGYLSTGGRYDPVSDTWIATATAGAPLARTDHTAVWTGRDMLVWGGYDNASPWNLVDTGGSYRATPGESCDGVDDDCDGAIDEGGDALCDDGNPCTDDSCHGSAGCVFLPNQRACNDENPCTAGDVCGAGTCSGTPLTGTACDDGNACTTNDSCSAGQCAGGPQRTCSDGDNCTDDACNPATGCYVVGPRTCNDGNVCTDDSCDPASGCIFAPNTIRCDDHNPCTTDEVCQAGQCLAGEVPCNDHNPCTDDICNSWGCSWVDNSLPCDDRNQCTLNDTCGSGWCSGTPIYGTDCNDGDACTSGDTCGDNGCGGIPRNCDDANGCTDDECNYLTGECVHFVDDTRFCTDGDACTVGETCHAGVCGGSAPLDCYECPPGFEQLGARCRMTYNMTGDYLIGLGHACDFDANNRYNDCDGGAYGFSWFDRGPNLIPVDVDLQFESGVSCDSTTSSVSLNATTVGAFTPPGSCLCFPLTRLVSFPNLDLNAYLPGDLNTISIDPGGSGCEGLSRSLDLDGYFARITVTYARHDPRCEIGSCASATGVCDFAALPDGAACGDACTETGACVGGLCHAPSISCDDGNSCTDDSCDAATGCVHVFNSGPCNDGNACTVGDACLLGACLDGTLADCDDQNACTDDTCNPAGGCVHTHRTGSCDDGNPCTSADTCTGGYCVGTPETGTPCDDGDACATGEVCVSGTCPGGTVPLDCEDHSICTMDWCDPEVGCVHDASQIGDLCDDANPCTANLCDPVLFCVFPPANQGRSCDDLDSCTHDDRCDDFGACLGRSVCDDQNPCTDDYASGSSCACSHEPTYSGTICDDGDACTSGETCDGNGTSTSCGGGTLIGCDDGNPCTTDTCDPSVGCVHANNANSCDDGNVCTLNDTCGGGTCLGTVRRCDDGNVCTTDTCTPATGCVFANNAEACSDGNACTRTDTCSQGACIGTDPVVCAASDPCHQAGTCNAATGVCSNPPQPDGSACDDNDLCTRGETCRAGTCIPASSGLNEPNPRTNGYYKRLCHGPHSGDQFTDADASCVAAVSRTFAGISTVADLCAELEPSQPNNDPCDRADDDLMVLALNICRARVCTAQSIDSQCGNSANVGQSLSESDAILRDARQDASCAAAKCLDEEINTGRALELNSLSLRRESGGVRLNWLPPYLDDGTGRPSRYNIWRRAQGSLTPFVMLGTAVDPTFFDAASGTGAFQYEVTAVMN